MSSVPQSTTPRHDQRTYLDIGCGGGIFAESAARLPNTKIVTAIDPTPECITVAKQHQRTDPALADKLQYLHTDIESLPLPNTPSQGADIVSLFEVIEHVQRPTAFLQSCMQHVKPGGWFVLSTISRTWTSWLTTKVVAEYALGLVPKGTHDWSQYINAEEMHAWARRQPGWGDVRAMGVVYVPGFGWQEVTGSEHWGNYFFAIRRQEEE